MRCLIVLILLATTAPVARVRANDPPSPPPVSQWAPADQLVTIARGYVTSMQASVVDEKSFEAGEPRLRKEANTLACLALALGLHDSDHELKVAAPTVYAAALQAAQAKSLEEARTAVAAVSAALTATDAAAESLTWKKTGSLGQLMKQVTFLHTRLKRGARPGPRFAAGADENANYATILAVIGQATALDTHEVKDLTKVDQWYQLSADMRDASAEASAALKARDPEATAAALKKLEQSCTQCHQEFRVEVTQ